MLPVLLDNSSEGSRLEASFGLTEVCLVSAAGGRGCGAQRSSEGGCEPRCHRDSARQEEEGAAIVSKWVHPGFSGETLERKLAHQRQA